MLPTIVSNKHGISYLCVDGKPFPILGGELHNSASSSLTYIFMLSIKRIEVNHTASPCTTDTPPVFGFALESNQQGEALKEAVLFMADCHDRANQHSVCEI